MIIDPVKGRIAYHSLLAQKDGSIDFVQYDFDGKEIERNKYRSAPIQKVDLKDIRY